MSVGTSQAHCTVILAARKQVHAEALSLKDAACTGLQSGNQGARGRAGPCSGAVSAACPEWRIGWHTLDGTIQAHCMGVLPLQNRCTPKPSA